MTEKAKSFTALALPQAQRNAFLEKIRPGVSPEDYQYIKEVVTALPQLLDLLQQKGMSLERLQRLLFGPSTERTDALCPPAHGPPPAPPKGKPKGHGRNGATAYRGARRVKVPHPTLKPGEGCPACQRGKLRRKPKPASALQITAQPPVSAVLYELDVLRCNLCGQSFTAPTPPEAGTQKYDPSVGVVLSLLRYGSGMPFYRLEQLQASLGIPLPASTQWELVEKVAQVAQPVFDHLVWQAAQAPTLHNDDTGMRVGELRRQIKAEVDPERTGIFTTGIVAGGQPHPIALFFTGRRHAGENLNEVLRQRKTDLPPPLQMCDGLTRNEPAEFDTRVGNCLVHARREFVEVAPHFPEACQVVLENLRAVYRFEAQTRTQALSAQQRLAFHQTHSQPVLEKLHVWLREQIEQKQTEPNSGLGKAINYLLGHWERLTLFLRHAGAPLDNNVAERTLKMAILHRKNSLSYKTQRGAQVGDLFMSLIHTCRLCTINPFDYLSALVAHASQAAALPAHWLPWNFRETLGITENTS
jgi:transposase